jgi:predicted RNase H-like HicB family nuclease
MSYHLTLVESEEGFAVWCDDLPGCCSQGATREEAIDNIKQAIRDYRDATQELSEEEGLKVTHMELAV